MPDVTDIPTQELETTDIDTSTSTDTDGDEEELIDPTLEDSPEEEDFDDEEDQPQGKERKKGDLSVALQKEREKRKALEAKLAQQATGSGLSAEDVRRVMRQEKALELFPDLKRSKTLQVAVSAKMDALQKVGRDPDPVLAYKLVAKELGLSQKPSTSQPAVSEEVAQQRTEAQVADNDRSSTTTNTEIGRINEQLKDPDLTTRDRDRLILKRMELRQKAQTA